MKFSKLSALRQVKIPVPCEQSWEAMTGDEEKRHCAGCGCDVHNLEAIGAAEAEALLNSPDRVCTRIKVDAQKGILTRDGWVPRMLMAGAVVASGFASPQDDILGQSVVPVQQHFRGKPAKDETVITGTPMPIVMGRPVNPTKKSTKQPAKTKAGVKKSPKKSAKGKPKKK